MVLGKPLRLSSLFTASRGESNLKKRRRQEEEEARGSRGVEEFGGKDVEPIIDLAACHRLVLLLAAFLPTNSSRQRHYSKQKKLKDYVPFSIVFPFGFIVTSKIVWLLIKYKFVSTNSKHTIRFIFYMLIL